MLKNLLLGTIPYDDGTKKLVIKWFGDAGVCELGCNKWQKVHNLAKWTSSGTSDWWMTPVNDKDFHVNDNRCVSLLYCFYVCVLRFSALFSRKLSCFLRCSRVPYSWIAPSGSSIPGDPSSVTSGLQIPGIETKPIHPEMFRMWVTNSDSDVAHNSLFGES